MSEQYHMFWPYRAIIRHLYLYKYIEKIIQNTVPFYVIIKSLHNYIQENKILLC